MATNVECPLPGAVRDAAAAVFATVILPRAAWGLLFRQASLAGLSKAEPGPRD